MDRERTRLQIGEPIGTASYVETANKVARVINGKAMRLPRSRRHVSRCVELVMMLFEDRFREYAEADFSRKVAKE